MTCPHYPLGWLLHLVLFPILSLGSSPPSPATYVTTIVGPPETLSGPNCCAFDSPYLGLQTSSGTVLGYTSNSECYLFSKGPTIDAQLPTMAPIGLQADPSNTSYSHCGKWLNAAWQDPLSPSTVHGYFHQEWRCDYAHNLYTNKSVGYAVSTDGGLTFSVPDPAAQLLAGSNFSAALRKSQCGEGDHGVVQLGDWLYIFFLEWDSDTSIHGGTSAGVARSSLSDAGRPGTWWKWYKGGWGEPGVGGNADSVAVPGTAVYSVAAVPSELVSVGVMFSNALQISWTVGGDPTQWDPAQAGPLFTAGSSSWSRNSNSSELFGYPALSGPLGVTRLPSAGSFVYFTYLNPGFTFNNRYLVRRPLSFFAGSNGEAGPPSALATLSLWQSSSSTGALIREWATTGPVTNESALTLFSLTQPQLALLATWSPPAPAPPLIQLHECLLPAVSAAGAAGSSTVALTLTGECGAPGGGAFTGGTLLRPAGWLAATASDALALGWCSGSVQPLGGGPAVIADALPLWRCSGTGVGNFSAALGALQSSCDARGWGGEATLLGFALSPLRPA